MKSILRGLIAIGAMLISTLSLAQSEKVVMGVSIPAATNGWTSGVAYWANRTKGELEKKYRNIKIIIKAANSSSEQINQIRGLHTVNKINTLVILPFEPIPLSGPIAQLKDKGVFVTVIDRALTDVHAQNAYVTGDNYGFGKVAGQYIAQALDGKGDIVILRGPPGAIDNQRVNAFNEVIKAHPGIRVLDAKHGNWNRNDAFKLMQDYLARFKRIDAVWASDDEMAAGVQKAIAQAKRTDIRLVLGGTGAKDYVKKIMDQDKIVTADIAYSPSMIADAMRLTAEARTAGNTMPATTIIPAPLITKENAAQFYFPDSPF
ncbi:MAG: substrate-binding domain-containing protein [Betaproteobacteria bacterium]|nr:substrate-binding domain-containing protein [Betaproteobacteria bacterium]